MPAGHKELPPNEGSLICPKGDSDITDLLRTLSPENFDDILDVILSWVMEPNGDAAKGRRYDCLVRSIIDAQSCYGDCEHPKLFASLCREVIYEVDPHGMGPESMPFRTCLLGTCQDEYVCILDPSISNTRRYGDDIPKCLGLMQLIGELFNQLGLDIRLRFSQLCFDELRERATKADHADRAIKCLCVFLRTVGEGLDMVKGRWRMNIFISKLKELSSDKDIDASLQPLLLNVTELRENKWAVEASPLPPTLNVCRGRMHVTHADKPIYVTPPTTTHTDSPSSIAEPTVTAEREDIWAIKVDSEKRMDTIPTEFFQIRNIPASERYFLISPPHFHPYLVEQLGAQAVQSTTENAALLRDYFYVLSAKGLCSHDSFAGGFLALARSWKEKYTDLPEAKDRLMILMDGPGFGIRERQAIALWCIGDPSSLSWAQYAVGLSS